ncbi:MAG: heme-binding protein, partial [Solirubrobacterales bacterium]
GGAAGDLFIAGLLYQMRIADKETNEPLHLENGMWLNLGESQEKPIVRQASIPHGDVLLALGTSYAAAGPPDIPSFSALPKPGPDAPFGYAEKYPRSEENFAPSDPNEVLREAIEGKEIVNTTALSVSTEGGGIVNIPFVEEHAKTSEFNCTYWLETIKDPDTGDEVQQLQYSQQTNIEFIPKFGEPGLIMWPHVNVNTLRKQ